MSDVSAAAGLAGFLLDRYREDEADRGHQRSVSTGEANCPCGERGYMTMTGDSRNGTSIEFTHRRGWTEPFTRDGWVINRGEPRTEAHVYSGEAAQRIIHGWPLSADSRRVLADLDAKRRIVELHQRYYGTCSTCAPDESEYTDERCGEPWPCPTLRLLALPYVSHPDFRPEWRA